MSAPKPEAGLDDAAALGGANSPAEPALVLPKPHYAGYPLNLTEVRLSDA